MSSFMVDEAQESDGEEEEYTEDERRRLKKLKRLQSDSSEEEEDDEEQLAEVTKGFINDLDDEESLSGSESEGDSKKRKREDEEDLDADNLDEDDLDLIEENIGVKIDRKKKFKRLKRIEDEDSDDNMDTDDRTKIANEIFQGSDDDEGLPASPAKKGNEEVEYGSEGEEESDEEDFIVDDDGKPLQKQKKKPMFADAGLEAARDIFGCDFDYGEFEQYEDWESEQDEEEGDYEDDDEERETPRKVKEKRKTTKKTIYEVFEPSDLERGHLTRKDQEIRKNDIPERFQLRQIPVTSTRTDADIERTIDTELDSEAKWIYRHAFYQPFLSNQEGRDEARRRSSLNIEMIQKIYNSLDLIRNSSCEVPFIAFYRKEEVQPQLNIHDLWKIYKFDERWCQLKARKESFKSLFEKMRDYQAEVVLKDFDAPIQEDCKVIDYDDVSKLDDIETFEEFNDFYKHYLLYFGKDQEAVNQHFKAKQAEKNKKIVKKTVKVMRKVLRKKKHKKKANIDDEESGSENETNSHADKDEANSGRKLSTKITSDVSEDENDTNIATENGENGDISNDNAKNGENLTESAKSVESISDNAKIDEVSSENAKMDEVLSENAKIDEVLSENGGDISKENSKKEDSLNENGEKLNEIAENSNENLNKDAENDKEMNDIPDEKNSSDSKSPISATSEIRKETESLNLENGDQTPTKTTSMLEKALTSEAKEKSIEDEYEEVETEVETEVEEEIIEHQNEDEDVLKKAVRRHEYELLRRAGIVEISKKFGLTPEQFAENLRDSYQRFEVEQFHIEPLKEAENYITKMCATPERVLEAAVRMTGWQLACEPLVRKTIRDLYYERARIAVQPTPKGLKLIDEHHPLYTIMYLKDKPISDLCGDQFLRIKAGVEEKIITFSLSDFFDGDTGAYLEEMKQLYYRDEFSQLVQDWNDLRGRAVEFAFNKIIADLKRELAQRLFLESKEHVLEMCCRKLYNYLKVAPYDPGDFQDEDQDDWDVSKGFRVLSIAYLPDFTTAAFAALVDIDGDCAGFLRLPHILKRKNGYHEKDAAAKMEDLKKIQDYIVSKKPHVVVVGGESRDALMIVQDIKDILNDLETEEQFPKIKVELLDNEMSRIYSSSKKGQTDFLDYPPLLRQAVSLGRMLQNPLLEFAQLCNTDDEILNLKYHPLQYQLNPNELLEALRTEFVNRTNEVGVDLNTAVAYPHTQNVVQFVCGLGPRKAHNLIKMMKQSNSRLENRNQLVVSYHMGPKVFINCAGFIKIDTNALGDSDNYIEVLDSTRIHPEAYDWARKMAVDALEDEDANQEAKPAEALEEILESPERLSELDLEAFAVELNKQGFGKKNITLYDIRHELNNRYKDFRVSFTSPNPEEIFNMLTKETPETFYIGKLLQVRVNDFIHRKPKGEQLDNANPVRNEETGLWQCPFCSKNDFPELSEVWNHFDAEDCPGQAVGVRVRLDNGIFGFINIKNLSDKTVTNPSERVKRNGIVYTRILKIDPERFSVDLTSTSSDLQDVENKWKPQKDAYYDYNTETKDSSTLKKKSEKKKIQYHKRVIAHPSFKNVDFAEAEKVMENAEQGDAVIRPSSKGVDHLTVTWKVANGICQHIDVKEQDKRNDFSLGQKLWIGNEEFEDLDEILARYVSPMATHARQIIDYKYYKESYQGNKEKLAEHLKEDKKKNPKTIPYLFSSVKILAGKFMLSYLPRTKVIHEYIGITSDGFKFRNNVYSTLAQLLKWFKMNFRSVQRGPVATPGRLTTRTPYLGGVTPSIAGHQSMMISAANTPHFGTPYSQHFPNYANTPYTPSGQTPFMTPYAASPGPPASQRYTPRPHSGYTPAPMSTPAPMEVDFHPRSNTDWQKAAQAWAAGSRKNQNRTPRDRTPRFSEQFDDRASQRGYPTPRSVRSTPKTINSPASMSLGDQTPLYDE